MNWQALGAFAWGVGFGVTWWNCFVIAPIKGYPRIAYLAVTLILFAIWPVAFAIWLFQEPGA